MIKSFLFYILLFIAFFPPYFSNAQKEESHLIFAPVKPEDFSQRIYSLDSNANAIILSDVGVTTFEGNKYGWFNYVFKRSVRIKILNNNGYEASKFSIVLYHVTNNETKETREEILSDVKAVTYNFENNSVTQISLDPKDIFVDKLDKKHDEKKFTLPAIKEGSIIDVSYTITSPFDFELQKWDFQDLNYPTLFSEYNISIPQLLDYHVVKHGMDSFSSKKSSETYHTFSISLDPSSTNSSNFISQGTPVYSYSWAMKNIHALKLESYVSSWKNYIDEIEFQLGAFYNGQTINKSFSDWNKTSATLLRDQDFGGALDEVLNEPDIDNAIADKNDKLNIAKNLYDYIKNNIVRNDEYGFFVHSTLANMISKHSGNVGEINLLLINYLRKYDISADPVILSTREHGFTFSAVPMIEKFNYLICKANIDGTDYYLDASHPNLGFGKLPPECYNGAGRVINANSIPISFSADSLKESSMTTVYLSNGDKGLEGNVSYNPGYIKSYQLRNELSNEKQEDFFKDIKKKFDLPVDISNTSINTLSDLENPVNIKYDVKVDPGNDDIIYFNPILLNALKENPFQAEQRAYPVEMPYCQDNIYVLNMETPKGYVIDELPKSTRVMLNESDGMFEYLIGKTDNGFQMRCRLKLNKANFEPSDYQNLRDFYSFILKQENEQVVFKKIK